MKSLFEGVADVLLKDSDLKKMVGFTSSNQAIRRGYQPTGEGWEKLIVFYFQPEQVMDFHVSKSIRVVPLIIRVYDRVNDLNVEDMAERCILLLDGADLGVKGEVFCYDTTYVGELQETTDALNYDDEFKSYIKLLRFEIRFRVDQIIGSTGKPIRRRLRESI